MSFKVQKTFTISGKEAKTLELICDLARRYIEKQRTTKEKDANKDTLYVDEYFYNAIRKMQELMREIWGT